MSFSRQASSSPCRRGEQRSMLKADDDIFHMVEFRPRSKTMSEIGKYRRPFNENRVKRTISDEATKQNRNISNLPKSPISRTRDGPRRKEKGFQGGSFKVDSKSDKQQSLIRPRANTVSDMQRQRIEKPKIRKRSSYDGFGEGSTRQSVRIVKKSLQNEKQVDSTWDTMRKITKNESSDRIKQKKVIAGKEKRWSHSEPLSLHTAIRPKEKESERSSFKMRHGKKYDVAFYIPRSRSPNTCVGVAGNSRSSNAHERIFRNENKEHYGIQDEKGETAFQNPNPGFSKILQDEIPKRKYTPDIRLFDHEGNSKFSSIESTIQSSEPESETLLPPMRKRANTVTVSSMRKKMQFLPPNYSAASIDNCLGGMEETSARSSVSSIPYENDFQNPYRLRAFTMADPITLRKIRDKISKRHNVSKQSYNGSNNLRQSPCREIENFIMDEGNDIQTTNAYDESVGIEHYEKSARNFSKESEGFEVLQFVNDQDVEIPDLESPCQALIQSNKSRNHIYHKKNVRYNVSNDMSERIRKKRKSHDEDRRRNRISGFFNSLRGRMRKWFCASAEEEIADSSCHSSQHRLRTDTPFTKDFDK